MSEQVLINRATIHNTRRWAKAVLAAICWGNSAVTMVLTSLDIQWRAWGRRDEWGIGIGIALAIALSAGQIWTSDASRGGYWICLLPDLATTAWQWSKLLQPLVTIFIPVQIIAALLSWSIALVIGYHSSRLPERLVFGPRKEQANDSSKS